MNWRACLTTLICVLLPATAYSASMPSALRSLSNRHDRRLGSPVLSSGKSRCLMSDDIDRANDRMLFDINRAVQQELARHRLTLQRIVAESVLCLDCDKAIPANRLAALPLCIRCIQCQTAYEQLKTGRSL
ncbi:TraR/DksA C4-type zinc finger protein [Methylobacter sp. S3L5C]|uniref:TraR/DksA C4-type zinc finger protein n=1 Tax=Methylobacter sp. S3L5C TaxID=2839024 RepID=UPI001FAE37D8|nr:TraR/DksA C4-type zinc finger protein [Methylobacter sp. S3L5C]UOA07636.1 TraR/DksA C4-type zinc finger protein [Methylobacter sp. S3L5C]